MIKESKRWEAIKKIDWAKMLGAQCYIEPDEYGIITEEERFEIEANEGNEDG